MAISIHTLSHLIAALAATGTSHVTGIELINRGYERFTAKLEALGADFEPLAFVSLPELFVVAEKGGQANDPSYLAAKPYLERLDYLMIGSRTDAGRTTMRFAVGVR